MSSRGTVVVTGASGTVGSALLPVLSQAYESLVCICRRRPEAMTGDGRFLRTDLGAPQQLDATCETLSAMAATGPVRAVVLAAGVDDHNGFTDIRSHAWQRCMMVNAYAQLRILGTVAMAAGQRSPLPVVIWSSDVVGASRPDSVVYAASKAALEEGVRQATADIPAPGLATLVIRLPDIGVPMDGVGCPDRGALTPGQPLAHAVNAAVAFAEAPPTRVGMVQWHE